MTAHLTRRELIATGMAGAASVSGLAVAEAIGDGAGVEVEIDWADGEQAVNMARSVSSVVHRNA